MDDFNYHGHALDYPVSLVVCPHFGRPLDFPTECSACSSLERRLAQGVVDDLDAWAAESTFHRG